MAVEEIILAQGEILVVLVERVKQPLLPQAQAVVLRVHADGGGQGEMWSLEWRGIMLGWKGKEIDLFITILGNNWHQELK